MLGLLCCGRGREMLAFSKLSLIVWTVRYLRVHQIVGQVRCRLRAVIEQYETPNEKVSLEYPACRWSDGLDFLAPGVQNNKAQAVCKGKFRFLNKEESIGLPPKWHCPDLPKLWQYNLHYFEWLWALDYNNARSIVLDWIEKHPIARDAIGWDPYPTSLRLVNWCAFFWGRFQKRTEMDNTLLKPLWSSIYAQTEWLNRHLETHLLGNHYLENGAALAFVGSCFNGVASDRWFRIGMSILAKEIPEQILPDGMHFELSPMYHSRILYLTAILMATGNSPIRQLLTEPLVRMARALKCLCHPDGQIALLNDSAFGVYNRPEQLMDYCSKQVDEAVLDFTDEYGPFSLSDAGYYGWRSEDGNYVICDTAPIGPDYIPGHAHADIFSFELSLKGRRVVVDSGVFDYEISPTRQYCRSTKAHNTIEIERQDQCEMWGAFRVARRGRPRNAKWIPTRNGFQLSALHDGYNRLKGSPVHYREFNWNKSGRLIAKDVITTSKPQSVVSRVHLHPDCRIDQVKASTAWVTYPEGNFRIVFSGNGRLSIENSFYCPEFGKKIDNKALAYHAFGDDIEISLAIELP